jgi:hypothetical protein
MKDVFLALGLAKNDQMQIAIIGGGNMFQHVGHVFHRTGMTAILPCFFHDEDEFMSIDEAREFFVLRQLFKIAAKISCIEIKRPGNFHPVILPVPLLGRADVAVTSSIVAHGVISFSCLEQKRFTTVTNQQRLQS